LPLANLSGDAFAGIFFGWDNGSVDHGPRKVGSLRGDFADFRNALQRHEKGCRNCKRIERGRDVEGSVVKSGQKIRITAQLLDGPSDRHLWAESYERDFGDVLKLQNDVAEAIAVQVRAELSPGLRRNFARRVQ